jgi:lactate racemase
MATERMSLKRADSHAEALEMAEDTVGPNPSRTYMHIPPLFMCEVS